MFAILAAAAVKSAMVFALAWVITKIMGSASAAARHLVWISAMAVALMLPAASAWMPALQIPAPAAFRETAAVFPVNATVASEPESTPAIVANRTTSPTPTPAMPRWRTLVLFAWATGSLAVVLQMLLGYAAIRRLRRSANRTQQRIDGVEILESPARTMPMTTGILKPAVFLPADFETWPGERRDAVLAHELAHVQRRDSATQLLARTAVALYWWNPFAWLAWRESLKERERAADDLVLASGVSAPDYAAHLLEIARDFSAPSAIAVAMARPSQLEGRLLAILDSKASRTGAGRRSALAAAACAIAVMAPLAAVRAQEPAALPADLQATIHTAQSQRDPGMLEGVATAAEDQRNFDVARKLLEAALEIRAQTSGTLSADYGMGVMRLANLKLRQHGLLEAAALYSHASDLLLNRPEQAAALVKLGEVEMSRKNPEGAASYFLMAQASDPANAAATMWLAVVRDRQGNADEADALFKTAIAAEDPKSVDAQAAMKIYADFLQKQGRSKEAATYLEQAKQLSLANWESARAIKSPAPSASAPFRIGGGVSAPSVRSKVEPEYAEEARLARLQGTVVLTLVVGEDGTPRNVVVVRPLGLGLDDKAVEAVSRWKFNPGVRGGGAVPVIATIEVNFRLL